MKSCSKRSCFERAILSLFCAVLAVLFLAVPMACAGSLNSPAVVQNSYSGTNPQSDEVRARFKKYLEDALQAVYQKHDVKGAVAIFREALTVNPTSPEIYYALSQLVDAPEDVIDACQKVMDYRSYLNPAWARLDVTLLYVTDSRLFLTLGQAYQKLGDFEKAKYYYEKVIADNTSERRVALAYVHLGEIARRADPKQSVELITQGKQIFHEIKDRRDAQAASRALWRSQLDITLQVIKEWNSLPDMSGNRWILLFRALAYVLFCFLVRDLALSLRRQDSYLAWIPLLQWGLICDMACLPWVFMFLTCVIFIPGAGPVLFLMVKLYFMLMLLIRWRQPLWLLVFPLTALPFIDLFYWSILSTENSDELYRWKAVPEDLGAS